MKKELCLGTVFSFWYGSGFELFSTDISFMVNINNQITSYGFKYTEEAENKFRSLKGN